MSTFENDEVLIGVLGPTGAGKTSFINLVSGSNLRVGQDLESCTDQVDVTLPFEIDGRHVRLVDTPGFDDTTKSDADVLRLVGHYLVESYESGKKLAGILYFHRISDVRMGGISRRNFHIFRELCGNDTLKNVVIVTTMWGKVTPEEGGKREHQLATDSKFFAPAITAGAEFLRHLNTKDSAQAILRQIVNNTPLPLQFQREIVDEKKNLDQTTAGGVLLQDLKALKEEHQKEKEEMRREMEQAGKQAQEELRQEIARRQEDVARLQADMNKVMQNFREDMKRESERHLRERELDRQERMQESQNNRLELQAERTRWANQALLERQEADRKESDRRRETEARNEQARILAQQEAENRKESDRQREIERQRETEARNEQRRFTDLLAGQDPKRKESDRKREIELQKERQLLREKLEQQEEERRRREAKVDAERRAEIQRQQERLNEQRRARAAQAEGRRAREALEKEKSRGFWDRSSHRLNGP